MPRIGQTSLSPDAILLTGKRAIVTGGGGGIGEGIAMALAAFGAEVAIIDINAQAASRVVDAIRAKGGNALAIISDVIDRDAARAALADAVAQLGGLDILVNNAGGTRFLKLVEMTDRQIDRQLDFNLKSLIALTQSAARVMIEQGQGGAIINIASIEGFRAAPFVSVYAACKAGMLNFTRSAALELAEHRIRVNAIAPDLVPTPAMMAMSPTLSTSEGAEAVERYIPLGRPGSFDDCAGAAVFLASSMASYITGTTLNVDGGTWASSGWTRNGEGGWRLFN